MTGRFARQALLIFAVALTVRAAHVWFIRRAPFFDVLLGDARGYDAWAREIAAGDIVGHDVFYQAPLYAYFLGGLYAIHPSLLFVRMCQAVLGAGACVLLASAGRRLFSLPVGITAGLMLACYAPAVFFDALVQKSVLDVFLLCLLLALVAGPMAGSRWRWAAVGITAGALSLTRENALIFIPVLATWIWLTFRSKWAIAMLLAGAAVVVLPVGVRNRIAGGEFHLTTSQAGANFYIGNHARADGTYVPLVTGRGSPEYERADATRLAEQALGHAASPGEVSSYWTSRALEFIGSHPAAWLSLEARKVRLLVNRTEVIDTESQEAYEDYSPVLRTLAAVWHFGVLAPLAALGLWLTRGNRHTISLLWALSLTYAVSVLAFYVVARYRLPLVPFLIVFAAAGVVRAFQMTLGSPSKPAALRVPVVAGGAVLAAFAVFCNVPALSANTMRAVTYQNLGAALIEEHRLDEAATAYQNAVGLAPDSAPAHNGLGAALRQLGRSDEAIQHLELAVRLGPDFDDARMNLANALADGGHLPDAIAMYGDLIQRRPGSADLHANFGVALAAAGRLDEAIVHLRRALALGSETASVHYSLGHVLLTRGDRSEAIHELSQAVRIDPANVFAHYELGHAYLEQQKFDDAVEQFRRAADLAPRQVEARNNLGIALASVGRLDEAIQAFRAALVIDPASREARANLDAAEALRRGRVGR